jgi:hypothetical protein
MILCPKILQQTYKVGTFPEIHIHNLLTRVYHIPNDKKWQFSSIGGMRAPEERFNGQNLNRTYKVDTFPPFRIANPAICILDERKRKK